MTLATRPARSVLALAAVLVPLGAAARAQTGPDLNTVTIAGLAASGNGCPAGSIASNISPDAKAMTLLFDSYVADSTEVESGLSQKTCDVDITLNTPPGWQFALFSTQFRGYASIDEGGSVRETASYSFLDNDPFALSAVTLNGPYDADYQTNNTVNLATPPYSKCGGQQTLKLKTEVVAIGRREQQMTKIVNCSSSQYRRSECETGTPLVGIAIEKQGSAMRCVLNQNFGISGSKVWVDRGCRADFRVAYMTQRPNAPHTMATVDSIDGELQQYGVSWKRCNAVPDPIFVDCTSSRYRRTECNTGRPILRAEVAQVYSSARCEQNRQWGISGNAIWVNLGCRAKFKVYPAP